MKIYINNWHLLVEKNPLWANAFMKRAKVFVDYKSTNAPRNIELEQEAKRFIFRLEKRNVFLLEDETWKERFDGFYEFCEKIS